MIRELSQGRFFIKRRIRIFENKVTYYESKFGKDTEITISYEDLANFRESHTNIIPELRWAIGVTALFSVFSFFSRNNKEYDPYIGIVFGLCFVAVSGFYFITREKVWKIKFQNYPCFFIKRNSPDKKTVDDFIEELFKIRKEYLKYTYFYTDKNLQYEPQLKNLQWLKQVEAITKEEFEAKRQELSDLFNTEKKSIGFSK